MLLQKEGIKKPIKRNSVRESMEDRLYLTRKRPLLKKDDDVIIDFDDDVDGIDVDEDHIKSLPLFKGNTKDPSTRNENGVPDNIQSILLEINNRLANIEDMLRKGNAGSSQKVTVTTQQTAEPVNESLVNGDIMSRLRPPQNVIPEGSMLGEIQSVLAQQASMDGNSSSMAGANDVSGVCTLPNAAYDDEVPDIEV